MFKPNKVNFKESANQIYNIITTHTTTYNRPLSSKKSNIPSKLGTRISPLKTGTNNKQLWSEYVIYAKSMLLQINEEIEMKILTNKSFHEKKKQIMNSIKKCDIQNKFNIFIQLTSLYKKLKIRLEGNLYEDIIQMLGFFNKLGEKNERKFCEVIFIERIDEVLLHILKSYPDRELQLIERIMPIIHRMEALKQKLQKIMLPEEYKIFLASLTFWRTTQETKNKHKPQSSESNCKERESLNSKDSFCSIVSDTSQQIRQKLDKLQNLKQSLNMLRRVNSRNRKSHKKSVSRYGSIRVGNSFRRVSSMWGRQQSGEITSKQAIKRSDNSVNTSKFSSNNAVRKSITIYKNSQQFLPNNQTISTLKQSSKSKVWFHPFYFYTVIKGIIRINYISSAEILGGNSGIRIDLGGYFTYPLTFYRFPSNFLQNIDPQRFKKFLMANLELKQKSIWSVLTQKPKLHLQSSQPQRNLISQLLHSEETFIFYGFIKRMNVYFFSKYESKRVKQKQGVLTIYDTYFESLLETMQISNWKKKQMLKFEEEEESEEEENYIQRLNGKYITVSETNSKVKEYRQKITSKKKIKIGVKTNANTKDKSLLKYMNARQSLGKKEKKNDTLHFVVKKQDNFVIVTESERKGQIYYSNTMFQNRFRNFVSMRSDPTAGDRSKRFLFEHFISGLNRKNGLSTMSILNKKISKPEYANIKKQLCFVKKIKKLGYVMCKIFIFKPQQSQLILTEVYLPQNQRYYTFFLKPTVISMFFNTENPNSSAPHTPIQDHLAYLIKLINLKIKNTKVALHSIQFQLVLEMNEFCIESKELLYRVCKCDERQQPIYIESIMFETKADRNNLNQILIRREVNRISKNLNNHYFELTKISDPIISKKYGKYTQFIKGIRNQLKKRYQQGRKPFSRDQNIYYYRLNRNQGYTVKRAEFNEKQWTITTYNMDEAGENKMVYNINDIKFNTVLKKLKGKSLIKYFGRIIKDPLLFKLFQQQVYNKQ